MRLITVLAIAVLAVPGAPARAATSVFAPRPPHDAPPEVFKSDESALGAFITAQCKIQDAMGKTSAPEANELIASAEEDLRRADQGFGDVAKALGDAVIEYMTTMLRVLPVLALCSGLPVPVFAADTLDEVRRSFPTGGKPIPLEIFADFGDATMSDSRPIVVTIDANAAIDSNRYADPLKTKGRWVEQTKLGSSSFNGPETMSYEFRGATANGMLVLLAAWSGGGSGTFYYLHILDATSNRAFDEDGSTYSRVDLTLVRTYILGDRWQGDVSISGNSVRVVTNSSLGGHGVASVTIDARKP